MPRRSCILINVPNTVADGSRGAGTPVFAIMLSLIVTTDRAAGRFNAAGDDATAALARIAVIAQLSALTALVFVSDGADPRLCILFGLGFALDSVARLPVLPSLTSSSMSP